MAAIRFLFRTPPSRNAAPRDDWDTVQRDIADARAMGAAFTARNQ